MRSVLLLLLLLLCAADVGAVAIGVNRASLQFNDVLRGGYAREEIIVTTDSDIPLSGEVLLYGDETTDWLNFSKRNFTFSRDEPYRLYVEALPPQDARIDTYRVNMSIITGELTRSDGGLIGTATRASLGVPIIISMTGTERRACQVNGLVVRDTERDQQLEVSLSILNTGNVRVNPKIDISIYDKLRADIVHTASAQFGRSVLPTRTEQASVFFPLGLQRDQYWALVEVPECGYSGMVTFDVLETGETKDDGELIRIDADSRVGAGDIVPITAVFRNRGVRSVRANFRGTITSQTGEVVKIINTETYIVDPGVTADIETFFNPITTGRYLVEGKVFYNEKLTTERSVVINADEGSAFFSGFSTTRIVLYGLLLLIILFLILIVRKKKRRRQRQRSSSPMLRR